MMINPQVKLQARIERWLNYQIEKKMELSRAMVKHDMSRYHPEVVQAMDALIYSQDQLIKVLVDAQQAGQLSQDDVDKHIERVQTIVDKTWLRLIKEEGLFNDRAKS